MFALLVRLVPGITAKAKGDPVRLRLPAPIQVCGMATGEASGKESTPANAQETGFDPGWRHSLEKEWKPAPIFLPGKSHAQSEPGRLQFTRLQKSRTRPSD